VFQPTPDEPIDFEATVEATLLDLSKRFAVRKILFDPWQMQAVAQRLTKTGLRITEFPQTVSNLTAASTNLFELLQGRNIVLYPDANMRLAISRAIAVETARGWRIAKEKQAHKIDSIVALAMAAHAALQAAAVPPEEIPMCAPAVWSSTTGWSDEAAKPRTTHQVWVAAHYGSSGRDSFAAIGGRTTGPPPGSGRREW
jgi:hypothetical protein